MNERPSYYSDVEACVEETLRKVGRRIALGTPLGPLREKNNPTTKDVSASK